MAGSGAETHAPALEAPPPLAATRLTLSDFRCYRSARIAVEPRPVVLFGPNGAGKTNLLEALSFLVPGRGLRRARLAEVDRKPAAGETARPWAIAATVAGPEGGTEIGTGRDADSDSGERRLLRIDGAPAKTQTALAEHVRMVWLTPQMDRLFVEGAAPRRRFLDRLVFGFHPEHARRLAAYEQAMRDRARLLREGPADPSWLGALEAAMAEHGGAVAEARRAVADELSRACAEARGPFPRARLTLLGTLEEALAGEAPAAVAEAFRRRLLAQRRSDGESGITAVGVHRSDFALRHLANDRDAADCSTGEQKALLIAVVLAHARLQARRFGAAPILLLDEVAAHLDAERRSGLYREIAELGAQAWLTGTDAGLFAGLADTAQFLAVKDATISPAAPSQT